VVDKIKKILEIPCEDRVTELKRIGNDTRVVSKIIETIVAMTNTDGGIITIGVDDPENHSYKGEKRIFGIEENKENYDEIGRNISRITPPLNILWPPELIQHDKNKTITL
jgi:predicted HTH transcriptional regulator